MLNFKISSTNKGQERIQFPSDGEFGKLIETISSKVGITVDRLVLTTAFPPVTVFGTAEERVQSLNLVSGSVIAAREGEQPSLRGQVVTTVTAPANGNASISASSSVQDARGSKNTTVNALISMGFDEYSAVAAVAIAGDDLVLAVDVCQGLSASVVPQSLPKHRAITRRVIDADNSCLFNALGYLMVRDKKQMNAIYRQMVAAAIQEDPTTYTPEFLDGKSTSEYASWILDTEKWGGEIEMNILSKVLQVEIAAVDVQSGKVYVYGDGNDFTDRVYVLYDGVHYDAIVSALVDSLSTSNEDDDVTTFATDDETIISECSALAADLQSKKQFVNLAGCDLKCLVCGKGLQGQADARSHASTTGHQNFTAV